jgi:hypothetical protein
LCEVRFLFAIKEANSAGTDFGTSMLSGLALLDVNDLAGLIID